MREQIAYYDARAPEYDDWWTRHNRYDAGEAFASAWSEDVTELTLWLAQMRPRGYALEIAAGTGNWTRELLEHVERVTALDASSAMLERNAAKVASDRVNYVVADVLSWSPSHRYNTVFFSFWMSLVPPNYWEKFWHVVQRSLAPDGVVLFIDSAHPSYAAENGPAGFSDSAPPLAAEQSHLRERRLNDGSAYTVVKRYWTPEQLQEELAALGWQAVVGATHFAFIYGTASRTHDAPALVD